MNVRPRTPVPIETPPPRQPLGLFAAFKFRDFRLLWFGLLISNFGTWMQMTAAGYQVVTLAPTPSLGPFYLGLLGLSAAVPVLVLSPIAGFVADRYPRRRVLFITNGVIVLQAFALALLTGTHHITMAQIMMLQVIGSAARAFDAPARQSWVPILVDREYVGNAIGLNSIAFNAPSFIGPAIAGYLIVTVDIAGSFYINSFTTIAVIVALIFMKESPPSDTLREPFFQSIARGLQYLFSHPVLGPIILVLLAEAILVRPVLQLLPAYTLHIVHADARGLGLLMSGSGLGSIGGALIVAGFGTLQRRALLWFASALVMPLALVCLGLTTHMIPAFLILLVMGLATLTYLGSTNYLIQTIAPDDMRGRAISVYSMILIGMVPAGALLLGSMGSLFGLGPAFLVSGGLAAILCAATFALAPALRRV